MYLKWGTVEERERGNGEQMGGGGQFTANQGSEWAGSRHDAKEGFQVSRKGLQGQGWGFPNKRGLSKDWVMHSDHANLVHIMLIM
jgi:hypothetical protein